MSNQLQVLQYRSVLEVRMVIQNGEPWWVLLDVCKILGLGSPHKVADRLDEDERNQIPVIDSLGREQKNTIINESGLYSVILRSDKPEAKAFKRWVTHEVLPSIRRTGKYSVGTQMGNENDVGPSYTSGSPYMRKTARLLWYTLRQIAACGEVRITNLRLMELMNVGSEQTLRTARKELIQAGYVEYTSGVKGKPGIYKILPEGNHKALP